MGTISGEVAGGGAGRPPALLRLQVGQTLVRDGERHQSLDDSGVQSADRPARGAGADLVDPATDAASASMADVGRGAVLHRRPRGDVTSAALHGPGHAVSPRLRGVLSHFFQTVSMAGGGSARAPELGMIS